jgi:hypothetical protein
MSDRTAPALARLDALLPLLKALPPSPVVTELNETAEALRRAFHMEAIRFRMYGVDRLLKTHGTPEARSVFDDLRHALEEAGFHTRSHAAPDKA